MAKEPGPLNFRVSAEERFLLEQAAAWVGARSVSAFVRETVMEVTDRLLDNEDAQKFLQRRRELNAGNSSGLHMVQKVLSPPAGGGRRN